MHQRRQTKFKLIDLSSESEEEDKQNFDSRTYSKQMSCSIKASHKPCTLDEGLRYQNSSIINQARSIAPLKEMQYSTLSLQDSEEAYDNRLKSFQSQKSHLVKENQELKSLNKELQKEINNLLATNSNYSEQVSQYEQKIYYFEEQINELKNHITSLETSKEKAVKECQNKLINYQLPGNRYWQEEVDKLYRQVQQNIKSVSEKYLKILSQQKMNNKVEDTITSFINELIDYQPSYTAQTLINLPKDKNQTENKFQKSTAAKPYCSKRISELTCTEKSDRRDISQDYKLLSKSIEKLKNMEKQIDKCSGSYLKKPTQDDNNTHTKSILLDQSSILGLDRSKSRRKRIFQ